MKKSPFSYLLLLPLLYILSNSCSKNNDVSAAGNTPPPASLHLLQNKWILSSLKAYPTRDFSGADYIGVNGNGTDYYDFRADGNIYMYALGVHDTAAYKFLSNDSTLLLYGLNEGVKVTVPDTAIVIKITTDSLFWWHRNQAGDYAKFSFVK